MNKIEIIANKKKESRDIVKTIIDFGVTEDQKIDIIYFLSMTMTDNNRMKEICNFIKKYKTEVGEEDKKEKNDKKIIIT